MFLFIESQNIMNEKSSVAHAAQNVLWLCLFTIKFGVDCFIDGLIEWYL